MHTPSVCFDRTTLRIQKTSTEKEPECCERLPNILNGCNLFIYCTPSASFSKASHFIYTITFATLMFFLLPTISLAAQVTLAWDPNSTSPDGYLVFKRIDGQEYNYNEPAWPEDGNDHTETTCTIEGLTEGVTYHFVVKAYIGDAESGDSNEISYQVPLTTIDEEEIWIEAEDGDIDWPMIIADDPEASEGGYIHAPAGSVDLVESPTDSTGSSSHTFEVASDAEYSVWGRVMANNADGDSFHVAMDDSDYTVWSVSQTPTDVWNWELIDNYHLEAGIHKLIVATRQAGTRLDRIVVTNALDYEPPDMSESSSDAAIITQNDWQLVSVDSEELVGEDGAAVNAFDGNPDTIWHTEWRYSTPTHPHELV
ncbi:MAG: fibronectin type III domain-containing protein, partial [Desulfobacteraceae bacterium]